MEADDGSLTAGGDDALDAGRIESSNRKPSVGGKTDRGVFGGEIEVRRHAGQFDPCAGPETGEVELNQCPGLAA